MNLYNTPNTTTEVRINRSRGCLMGQFVGDSLGSLVEFSSPDDIKRMYPDGVRDMHDGGYWNTIAGQITDDSELALALARTLVKEKSYYRTSAARAYGKWIMSSPFDCGATIMNSLTGGISTESQSNGALMRVSPIGIFCAGLHSPVNNAVKFAMDDCIITHPNPVCMEFNAAFAAAITFVIGKGCRDNRDLTNVVVAFLCHLADKNGYHSVKKVIDEVKVKENDIADLSDKHIGWVYYAFRNAIYQLIHAESFEEAIVATIAKGGDTDTNAAICGALLGAVYGIDGIPERWKRPVLNCAPDKSNPVVEHPRPKDYWTSDAFELADQLLMSGWGTKIAV